MNPNLLFTRLPSGLQPLLFRLERQRKMARSKWLYWVLLLPVSLLISITLVNLFGMIKPKLGENIPAAIGGTIGFLFFVGGAVWISLRFPDPDDINDQYRKAILPLLVKDTLPGWHSVPDHGLGLKEIVNTGLFRDRANQVIREDYFTGPAGNATAKIYEVNIRSNALRKIQVPKGGSFYEREITTRFYGYFFFLSPVAHFSSVCWIFPRNKKTWLSDDWITVSRKQTDRERDEIKTGNAEFDAQFFVYAEDAAATRELLNATVCQKLIKASGMFPGATAFSFSGKHLYAMCGFPDDPLSVTKGLRIPDEIEEDHRKELKIMREFVETIC